MKIVCNKCSSEHELQPPAWVISSGRSFRFRCSSCGNSQMVAPPAADPAPPAAAMPASDSAEQTTMVSAYEVPQNESEQNTAVAQPPEPTPAPLSPEETAATEVPAAPFNPFADTGDDDSEVGYDDESVADEASFDFNAGTPFENPPEEVFTPAPDTTPYDEPSGRTASPDSEPLGADSDLEDASAVYLKQDGKVYMVDSWAAMDDWIADGRVGREDLVSEGGVRWSPIGAHTKAMAAFARLEAPSAPATPLSDDDIPVEDTSEMPIGPTPFFDDEGDAPSFFGDDSPVRGSGSFPSANDVPGVSTGLPPLPDLSDDGRKKASISETTDDPMHGAQQLSRTEEPEPTPVVAEATFDEDDEEEPPAMAPPALYDEDDPPSTAPPALLDEDDDYEEEDADADEEHADDADEEEEDAPPVFTMPTGGTPAAGSPVLGDGLDPNLDPAYSQPQPLDPPVPAKPEAPAGQRAAAGASLPPDDETSGFHQKFFEDDQDFISAPPPGNQRGWVLPLAAVASLLLIAGGLFTVFGQPKADPTPKPPSGPSLGELGLDSIDNGPKIKPPPPVDDTEEPPPEDEGSDEPIPADGEATEDAETDGEATEDAETDGEATGEEDLEGTDEPAEAETPAPPPKPPTATSTASAEKLAEQCWNLADANQSAALAKGKQAVSKNKNHTGANACIGYVMVIYNSDAAGATPYLCAAASGSGADAAEAKGMIASQGINCP